MTTIKCPHLQKSFKDIKLAINHDIFRYGILKSHQKLQNANLRRMIQYCLRKQNSKLETKSNDQGSVNSSNIVGSSTVSSSQSLNEDLCYPILSWQSWRYIAVNKLQITETLAWAYFDTYLALNVDSSPSKRKAVCDNKLRFLNYENPINDTFAKYEKQKENINKGHVYRDGGHGGSGSGHRSSHGIYDSNNQNHSQKNFIIQNTTKLPDGKHWHNYRSCETVPTLKFVFYLHIQQLAFDPKKSLRRSLSGENWPEVNLGSSFTDKDDIKYHRPRSKLEMSSSSNTPASPAVRPASSLGVYTDEMSAGGAGSSSSVGNSDEYSAIAHVRDSITEISKMCSPIIEKCGKGSLEKTGTVSEEILDAYNLFLTCFKVDTSVQYEKNLQSKFTDHIHGPVTESDLKNLIHSKIQISPGGITAVAHTAGGIVVKNWQSGAVKNKNSNVSSSGKSASIGSADGSKNLQIFTNMPYSSGESKRLIITNVHETSVIRRLPQDSHLYDVMIHRCDKATIYLLGNIKSLSIERCRNCTILTGAVLSAIKATHVRQSAISAASRSFIVTNSSDLSVNLHTISHPLLLSQCRRITFGPINYNFEHFDDLLVNSGLPAGSVDMFEKPLNLYDNTVASVVNTKQDRDRDSKLGFNSSNLNLRNNPNTVAKLLEKSEYTPMQIPVFLEPQNVNNLESDSSSSNQGSGAAAGSGPGPGSARQHTKPLSVEKLCELAPDEYKLCWLQKLSLAKSLKDEIKKSISIGKSDSNSQEANIGSNLPTNEPTSKSSSSQKSLHCSSDKSIDRSELDGIVGAKVSSRFINQNIQICFQNWLEENGYKEELERLGAGFAGLGS